jgi:hypothetical protein
MSDQSGARRLRAVLPPLAPPLLAALRAVPSCCTSSAALCRAAAVEASWTRAKYLVYRARSSGVARHCSHRATSSWKRRCAYGSVPDVVWRSWGAPIMPGTTRRYDADACAHARAVANAQTSQVAAQAEQGQGIHRRV